MANKISEQVPELIRPAKKSSIEQINVNSNFESSSLMFNVPHYNTPCTSKENSSSAIKDSSPKISENPVSLCNNEKPTPLSDSSKPDSSSSKRTSDTVKKKPAPKKRTSDPTTYKKSYIVMPPWTREELKTLLEPKRGKFSKNINNSGQFNREEFMKKHIWSRDSNTSSVESQAPSTSGNTRTSLNKYETARIVTTFNDLKSLTGNLEEKPENNDSRDFHFNRNEFMRKHVWSKPEPQQIKSSRKFITRPLSSDGSTNSIGKVDDVKEALLYLEKYPSNCTPNERAKLVYRMADNSWIALNPPAEEEEKLKSKVKKK